MGQKNKQATTPKKKENEPTQISVNNCFYKIKMSDRNMHDHKLNRQQNAVPVKVKMTH